MKVLEVKNLVKTFTNNGQDNRVLKHISFDMAPGEFVAIMGQSGSGKSTLLYNISGMDRMTSGQVMIDGVDLSTLSDDALSNLRLHKMGFVFQNNHLLKTLNIHDNICLPGYKAQTTHKKTVSEKATNLMKRLGIDGIKHHDIHKVSGGQLQRAAVCRALINSPKMLFADEPTGALNASASEEVLQILTHLNQDPANPVTILTVTHDVKVASATDRIIYLRDGVIEAELHLGKFIEPSTQRAREERTLSWLIERGF